MSKQLSFMRQISLKSAYWGGVNSASQHRVKEADTQRKRFKMDIEPNLRVFITGKTQSGKSYFNKKLLLSYPNRLVYDLKREYSALGFVVTDLEGLRLAINAGHRQVVYQPQDLSTEHFNDVCAFIFRFLRNIVFCVDECHNWATKSFIPLEFKRLITVAQGEPYNIGIIALTQRPANVHNDILSNASLIIVFKLHLQHDIKAVSEMTGIEPQDIASLDYYHHIIFNDRDRETPIRRCVPV